MSGRAARWLVSLARRPHVGEVAYADAAGECRLTILRHHRIYADDERPLYRLGISESVFASQLEVLVRHGLTPVTVDEGMALFARGTPGHRLALSFDDGYADNVTRALPRLRDVGGRATFYVAAGLVEERRPPWWDVVAHLLDQTRARRFAWPSDAGMHEGPLDGRAARTRALGHVAATMRVAPELQRRRLEQLRERLEVAGPPACELATWDQLGALVEAGMEIGAHTLSHPFLTTLSPPAQRAEIEGSMELLERRLGVRPRGLAYPGGDYDGVTVTACVSLGLAHAVTTRAGTNRPDTPRHELLRRGLSDGACIGPGGRFSERMMLAELEGAFDRMRSGAGVGA